MSAYLKCAEDPIAEWKGHIEIARRRISWVVMEAVKAAHEFQARNAECPVSARQVIRQVYRFIEGEIKNARGQSEITDIGREDFRKPPRKRPGRDGYERDDGGLGEKYDSKLPR